MYIPQHFEEHDVAVLHALVRAHPLGTWVTEVEGQLVVNHIPFILDATLGPFGKLVGHVARANPVWKRLSKQIESVVVFQGPQAYITPSWYPAKREHGKVVPTWNYAVVHAHGLPRFIEDREWLREHVVELTGVHETERGGSWSVSDAPSSYIDSMLQAIVGIEIPIARLVGKWKASQNRSLPDRLGVVEGLVERGDHESQQMARLVEERTNRID
ncbi:MAG TPA: FMN-binding negative transcriptional regulator [Vicinamibacterales bacterium]|nr:FMN-binding negative transcriptional regulator [Vicinamibacterales bacterium]